MLNGLTATNAFLITLPVFLFPMLYFIINKRTKRSAKSLKVAADMSTFFFILADHLFARFLFGRSFFLYLLLLLLILGICVVTLYAKREGEILYKKLLKGYWRFCFMFFSLLYLFLFIVGLVLSFIHILNFIGVLDYR